MSQTYGGNESTSVAVEFRPASFCGFDGVPQPQLDAGSIAIDPAHGRSIDSSLIQRLLSTREAATYLRLSPRTLEGWRCGKGGVQGPPFVKYGRNVFYRIEDLRAWEAGKLKHFTV